MAIASLSIGVQPPAIRRIAIASLAVTMTAATGAAVVSAGWTAASWVAVVIGVAGALEAAALLLLRPTRLLGLIAPPVLLVITLAIPYLPTVPVPPDSGPLVVAAHLVDAAVTGLLGNAAWEFNVALGTLLWACGTWAVEMALNGRRGALATAPCWAVLAVNVINSPAPNHAALASSVGAIAAVLLIAGVCLERLRDGWTRRGVPVLPGTDSRFAVAGAGAALVVLVLALVLPPLTSSDVSGRIFNFGGGSANAQRKAPPGSGGVGPAGTVRFDPATVPGGALTLAGTPVLTYHASTGTGSYLRMATDTVFDSGNWLPLGFGDIAYLATEINPPGPIVRDRAVADGGVGRQAKALSVTMLISDDTSGSNILPFPGEPDSASVRTRANGLHLRGSLIDLLTVDTASAVEPIAGQSLTTGGTQSTATSEQLRAAGSLYPAFIDRGGFLQLADDGTGGVGAIRTLAEQWTRNAANPYDRATAIENVLRNPQLFHYSLRPPLPDPSQQIWPVTYFLTTSHTGYCQYFASAMGAMLRALGIPARLVNGYGPGTPPDSAVRISGGTSWRVSSNDAHTWVEAYFPGYGWIPFEPTPPSQAGDYQTFGRGAVSQPVAASSAAPATLPPSHAPPTRPPVAPDNATSPGAGGAGPPSALTASLTVMVALGALFGVLAIWLVRPRGLPGIWRRVALLGRLVGVPRDRALTPQEYARRVTAALPADTVRLGHVRGEGPVGPRPLRRQVGTALEEIARISDQAMYAGRPLVARDAMRMRRAWRRVARVLPALGWRALLRRSIAP